MELPVLLLLLLIFWIVIEVSYRKLTSKEIQIKIKNKYTIMKNNKMNYIIIDDDNIEYRIDLGFFTTKDKCINMWDRFYNDEKYVIKIYGLNMPNIGINYKIIEII